MSDAPVRGDEDDRIGLRGDGLDLAALRGRRRIDWRGRVVISLDDYDAMVEEIRDLRLTARLLEIDSQCHGTIEDGSAYEGMECAYRRGHDGPHGP